MNTTTNIHHSLDYWYKSLGSTVIQEIAFIIVIPIGLLGIVLNIFALYVLRSQKFNLPFYVYLRAYTINSLFICLFNATQFGTSVRRYLKFTNSKLLMQYFCYVYIPLIAIINLYGSSLDIILSIDRVAILSKRIHWFRNINSKKLCVNLVMIFTVLCIPYWFIFEPTEMTVYLDKNTPITLHYFVIISTNGFLKFYFYIFSCVVDVIPLISETTLNILSVYLIKMYNKNRRILFKLNTSKTDDLPLTSLSNKRNISKQVSNDVTFDKSKKMEIKLTILVIILSVSSIL
jgi:hypothetical protein